MSKQKHDIGVQKRAKAEELAKAGKLKPRKRPRPARETSDD